MIRVVVLGEHAGGKSVRFLAPQYIVVVSEGGPAYCYVTLTVGPILKVAEPAAVLAERLNALQSASSAAVA